MTQNPLLDAALWYARRGWHVFPLRPGTKLPATPAHRADRCDRADPRCRRGHTGWEQRATCDPDRITRAWAARDWGIGIACGPSGLLVVDTDTATDGPDGETALQALAAPHGGMPGTWTVRTPSGGWHRYYTRPDRPTLGCTTARVGAHIDTRGSGGYVVAPPTRTPVGVYVAVTAGRTVALPAWLAAVLAGPRRPDPDQHGTASAGLTNAYVRAAVSGETRKVHQAPVGVRNQTLFHAAVALGQIVAAGALHPDTATAHLLDACTGHVAAGAFTESQAAATIRSGLRAGATTPRTLPTAAA
ncbi:MAG: bifunctional DNA primase/polymerase [Micrococcales bacterium]|nr:bifunctional DNA primase/polymerase [Micrococcales bacterium]